MATRLFIILTLLSLTIPSGAQEMSQACKDKRLAAVNSLRLINTAENMYRGSEGHYADLQTLVSSGTIRKAQEKFPRFSTVEFNPAEPVIGFDSHFVLSSDSTKYSVTVLSSDSSCQAGFATDERGLIYYVEPMR